MESNKLTIKDSSISFLSSFLLCQLAVVFCVIITQGICLMLNLSMEETSLFLNTASGYLIQALSLYLVMLITFFVVNSKKENKIVQNTKFKKLVFYFVIAIASFLTLYPIITCVDSLLVKAGAKINTIPYPLTTKNYLISLISLVIAPAICEELLFRGIIFKGLKKYGKIFSIIISSVMFSIYHMAISQTLYPLLMGMLLSVIMYKENNIYYCIIVHITNNFLALTLSYLNINLIFNHWTYILLAVFLLALFISIIVMVIIKNHKKEKQQLTQKDKIYLFSSLAIMLLIWIFANFI